MFQQLFRSLRQPYFRRYYLGQLVSIVGSWMQNVAQAWLVYRLTGSGFMLGLTAFSSLVPVLLLGLYGGVIADRYPRRKILIWVQSFALLQALVLGLLTITGEVTTWQVIALAAFLGCLNALEMPSRHAFIAELVDKSELPNAIALNSSTFTLARSLGPVLAGGLIHLIGEGGVFLLNALSYLWLLVILWQLPTTTTRSASPIHPVPTLAGLHHLGQDQSLRNALLLLVAISISGASATVLMPVLSHQTFGGGAHTLGWLLGSIGAGALLAALRLAYLGGRQNLPRNIGIAALVFSASLVIFSQQSGLAWAIPVLLLAGFASTTVTASINTLIQISSDDHLRGRLMALFSVIFVGMTSIGHLSAGLLSEHLLVPDIVLLFGSLCAVVALWYFLGLRARPD